VRWYDGTTYRLRSGAARVWRRLFAGLLAHGEPR
jgi:hypothetical protein